MRVSRMKGNLRPLAIWSSLVLWVATFSQSCLGDEPPPRRGKYAWQSLFDGRTLSNWRTAGFGGEGQVKAEKGMIVMEAGVELTGITYDRQPPRSNYEIALEGMKIEGRDFFCTTTFPVGNEPCTLVVGGWGGGIVGLSNLDGRDASENATTQYVNFESNKWYRVRIRVTDARIECWLDDEQVIDVPRAGHTFGIRPEVERNRPLGISTWQTTGAVRNIRLRLLPPADEPQSSVEEGEHCNYTYRRGWFNRRRRPEDCCRIPGRRGS
jgi:hypothetical protein